MPATRTPRARRISSSARTSPATTCAPTSSCRAGTTTPRLGASRQAASQDRGGASRRASALRAPRRRGRVPRQAMEVGARRRDRRGRSESVGEAAVGGGARRGRRCALKAPTQPSSASCCAPAGRLARILARRVVPEDKSPALAGPSQVPPRGFEMRLVTRQFGSSARNAARGPKSLSVD